MTASITINGMLKFALSPATHRAITSPWTGTSKTTTAIAPATASSAQPRSDGTMSPATR